LAMNSFLSITQKTASKISFRGKNRIIKFLFPKIRTYIPYYSSRILVDTSEHIGFNLFWNGGYEREVLWILDSVVNKDSVCLDIGANMGVYTIPLAEKAKKVIAFEPHPDFFRKLKDNVELNKFDNVRLENFALSSEEKQAVLHSPPENMANKSATMCDINSELTEKVMVNTKTLDSLGIERVDFIKIDTDGSDPDVILGGKETINRDKPVILFEYIKEFPDIKIKYDKAISFLIDIGYEIQEVFNKELKPFSENIDNFANLIATYKQ